MKINFKKYKQNKAVSSYSVNNIKYIYIKIEEMIKPPLNLLLLKMEH